MEGKDWELMLDVAKMRFSNYPPVSIGKILKKHKELNNITAISRLLKTAYEEKVFEIIFNDVPKTEPKRIDWLEKELEGCFPLNKAIVVDISEVKEESEEKEDDRVHEMLGIALALSLQNYFRPGDIIGVGSGRGVYNFAQKMRELKIPKIHNTQVVSLAGSMSVRPHAGLFQVLDADGAALHLATALGCLPPKRLILPAAFSNRSMLETCLREGTGERLYQKNWENHPNEYCPSVAIVGVGSLALEGKHRFICHDKEDREVGPDNFRKSLEQLKEFINDVQKIIGDKGYCPVGDICNRLFFVPPPPIINNLIESNIEKYNKLSNEIKRIIKTLNELIVSVTTKQLDMIDTVVAIAGGKFKLHAISESISRKRKYPIKSNNIGMPLINILCTDNITAGNLLGFVRSKIA
ncbi:hypothetical protein JW979_02935 [bacterium]|nr:hypothetical protein [candidate division CSSED10-310 bacterium]